MKKISVPLSAIICNSRLFRRTLSQFFIEFKEPTYAVNWCSPHGYDKHQNPKQIESTLIFELERRLKLKVDEVRLLLQLLYRYNSVCLLIVIAFLQQPDH